MNDHSQHTYAIISPDQPWLWKLLESLRDQHSKTDLGDFARAVLADVK